MGTDLSEYEKKSLIKFLALYIGSAFIFITAIAVLLYTVKVENLYELQKERLKNHASLISAEIIDSHMRGKKYEIPDNKEFKVALIGLNGDTVYSDISPIPALKEGIYDNNGRLTIVDTGTRLHHGIKYVVVQTDLLQIEREEAAVSSFLVWLISLALVVGLAIALSRQFLAPFKEEIERLDNFVKASAHELNTPITSLLLGLDSIKNELKESKKAEYLKVSAKMISKIHEDLTYYLQKETFKKEEEWIDFAALASEKGAIYSKLAAPKNIKIEITAQSFIYKIDKTAAERLIDNLLSNAVKYSKNGGKIELTVSQNLIIVKDYGIGIDKDSQKEIFDKFKRKSDIGGGFGLGLYIVKTICDDYRIKIEVTGDKGEGAEFRLNF